MSFRDSRHSASYDEDGNIILPMQEDSVPFVESAAAPVEDSTPMKFVDDETWVNDSYTDQAPDVTVGVFSEVQHKREFARTALLKTAASAATEKAGEALQEGVRQYKTSFAASKPLIRDIRSDLRRTVSNMWRALMQPVWVRSGKKHVKQYSRGTLFLFDIVRFGGTFTAIFGVLFAVMNYQSFVQIASARLEIFLDHPSLGESDTAQSGSMGALTASAADAQARERGDLFAYLPTVGPPEDRLIIPKLRLNVPLVNPPVEALLRQDWTQVEADIQTALANGVVHYPGSARPGQAGNFFVTGHSSYYPWAPGHYKTVFARLHELDIGDEYWVYFNGDRHRYIVESKTEVLPSDTSVLDQPGDRRVGTLMTCTPVGTTLRRLIVRSVEVDPLTGEALAVGERADTEMVPKVQLEALPI